MAVSLGGRRTIFGAISRSSPSIRRPTASISHDLLEEHGWPSSSSSLSPSSTNRSRKMDADRLSAVIDSVNDRKLPPELRGQRNVSDRRVWHAMEEGQFEKLPGKGTPLDLTSNPHVDPAEDTLYMILNKKWVPSRNLGCLKVFRYNLIVPFGRQMFGFKWEKELDRLQEES